MVKIDISKNSIKRIKQCIGLW